ncbi:hypothetical protein RRG08_045169 [Elysia crispata]|uniref:Uncharacterized protein n=1 Tax=Elysia crispata TaxID=231223 RepID=A0AAE1DWY4_9GAST|nr:hypothetical protein RRG08_045169 [Elysia crispata]
MDTYTKNSSVVMKIRLRFFLDGRSHCTPKTMKVLHRSGYPRGTDRCPASRDQGPVVQHVIPRVSSSSDSSGMGTMMAQTFPLKSLSSDDFL